MLNSFHLAGVKALDERHYEQAKELFLQAIDKNPEAAESYFYLGKCYFYCNEKQKAVSTIKKFIALCKDNLDESANVAYAFDLLAQCYEAGNRDSDALECYKTATMIHPDCASAWHNMGLFYIKTAMHYLEEDVEKSANLFKGAHVFIKKALELCSDNPVFLHSVASWYEQYIEVLKRVTEDEDSVQKNITSNFNYATQYYRKALSLCHEQDVGLKNIILSNFTECLAQYGHHLYRNKDYKQSLEIYSEALRLDPDHLIVINQIGMSQFKMECFPAAREYFSSILEKTEEKQEIADAWLNIACTYRLEKEWVKAEEALSKAKNFAPADSSIAEEELELTKAKLGALSLPKPQTFFGGSNSASPSIGDTVNHELSFQI